MTFRPFSSPRLRALSCGVALATVAALGAVGTSAAPRNQAKTADGIPGPTDTPIPVPPSVSLATTYGFATPVSGLVNADGINPSTLLLDGTGNFIGTTVNGGTKGVGTVFRVSPDGGSFTKLYDFAGGLDGTQPESALVAAGNNSYLGTTQSGGTGENGTIFQIDANNVYSIVYSFDLSTGERGLHPIAPLVADGLGNFYGTTSDGGDNGMGEIFRLNVDRTVTVLHSFSGPTNEGGANVEGANPVAALVPDGNGNFLGTAPSGGSQNGGTIFEIKPDKTFTLLYDFTNSSEGINPVAALTPDGKGGFFGVASQGGFFNQGTIFHVIPDGTLNGTTDSYSFLYSFGDQTDGESGDGDYPVATLLHAPDGNYYGTTQFGGANGLGTVFEIISDGTMEGTQYADIYDFTGGTADGGYPTTALVPLSTTDFYGTTSATNPGLLPGARPITPAANGPSGPTSNGSGTVYHLLVIPPAGEIGLPAPLNVSESVGTVTVNVTRFGNSGGAVTVPYTTRNFTAVAGVDYVAVSGTLSWADGDTSIKTITVPIIDRHVSGGGSVVFRVVLSTPTGGAVLAAPTNVESIIGVGIIDDDPAPAITSDISAAGQVGVAFSYQITASNNPTSFGATNLPAGLSVNAAGLITGTPTTSGSSTFGISATNINGTGKSAVQLTVAPAAVVVPVVVVPVINSATAAGGQVGVAFSYQITAANAPVSFGTSELPDGLSVDIPTGVISGVPTVSGKFAVTLYAANAAGTGTGPLAFTIAPAAVTTQPTQPTVAIVSPPDGITVEVGESVPLAASLTDPNGVLASVTFLVNGSPVGTVLGQAGPFVATAAASVPGVYTLTAIATDTLGRTNTSMVHVTAVADDPANPVPTAGLLTPINGRNLPAGTLLTISATASSGSVAGLDHVNLLVDGVIVATFDAQGNLITSAHEGDTATRRDASTTPLASLFTAHYQMPALDKILNMILTATDKLGHTSVSNVATFHSKVTTDRAPTVGFANLSSLVKVLVGSVNTTQIVGSDPDAATASRAPGAVRPRAFSARRPGPVTRDAASDALLASLEYWINGLNITKVSASPLPVSFSPPTAGKYILHAVATDGSGLSTVSDPVEVDATPLPAVVSVLVSGDGLALEGGENGKVAVRRAGDLSGPLSVRYKVAGSAKAGVDYKTGPITGVIVIPAGAAQVKVKIKPINDAAKEGTRVAKVKLLPSLDGSYALGTTSLVAKIKIIDND